MNLQNPNSLYSGGQGIFDSTPYRVAYERNQQLKAAKDDALDKYYQNLPNTVNAQGVRDQEVPIINEAKDQLQKFWMENRDAIRKGNTPANYNFQKMVRDVQGIVQESKNRTANNAKLAPYLVDPKYAYVRKNKNLMNIVAANDLPIGAEGSRSFNFSELLTPPPPFDPAKYINGIKIKPNPQAPTYQPIQGDKFNRLEITEKGFSDDDKIALHLQAQTEMDNNPSFEEEIKTRIKGNPSLVADITEKFAKVYGHKIENDGDLATAYTLSLMDLTPTQKIVANREAINDAKNAEWDRRNRLTFGQSMAKIAANKGAGMTGGTGYLSDEVASEVGEDVDVTFGGKTDRRRVIFTDRVDPDRLNVIIGRDLSKSQIGVKPIPMKQADGTVRMGYYQNLQTGDWEGDNGQTISRERVKDAYINKYAPSKFKSSNNTQASENTKGKPENKTTVPKGSAPAKNNNNKPKPSGW